MKEALLQYAWQYKLFSTYDLKTTENESIEIIDVGKLNRHAGPDFFNAKIKIGETLWAGNVEIHRNASDWIKHEHHKNSAYNNVILHVVTIADTEVLRQNGMKIPQLELKISEDLERKINDLYQLKKWVACENEIHKIPSVFINDWKNALLVERLSQKVAQIESLLKKNNNHWEAAFYIRLARNFGFGVNGQAFEQLARSLALTVLGKHKNNLFQIEALLFGQSSLLDTCKEDEYTQRLRNEHRFLAKKYQLKAIEQSMWKMARLRPDNFPHVRIAQFAALIYDSSKLFSKIISLQNIENLRKIFNTKASDYWDSHYRFGEKSEKKAKSLGADAVNVIIINTIVPFLYAYGSLKNNQEYKDRAFLFLEQLKAEKNAIVTQWKNLGIAIENAADSQAFLQLKKQYCDDKKCLYCRIGHKMLQMTFK